MLRKTRVAAWGFAFSLFAVSFGFGTPTGASLLQIQRVPQITKHRAFVTMERPIAAISLSRWLASNGYDVAGLNVQRSEVEVITDDLGLEALGKFGLPVRIQETVVPGVRSNTPDKRYLNPTTLVTKMQALHAEFPKLTRLEEIGRTLQNRPILAMLVSTTPEKGDARALAKPSILFDGGHHAREIMTPEVVLDVAESFLRGVREGSRGARRLLTEWNVWVVPMVNPDGANIVWAQDEWWRKNARADGNSIYGVDVNRNYAFNWNRCNGSSSAKTRDDYHGASAASEPETVALEKLASEIRPVASLSYHSYSEFIIYPLGCDGQYANEKKLYQTLAKELAASLPSDSGRDNYTPGTAWELLYSVDGGSVDYMYGELGALAFVFEINQDFQPPYELREPTVKKHRGAWRGFMDRLSQNLLTVVTEPGAVVTVAEIKSKYEERPWRANAGGYFFKVLQPDQYTIRVSLHDGSEKEATVNLNGPLTVDFR